MISFFPVRIFSSSPKLNFFINTPVPTATAAAGVAIFNSQPSISSKALLIVLISFGSPKAKEIEGMQKIRMKLINAINNIEKDNVFNRFFLNKILF